ncbi:transposase [Halovulum dunhuangense]|uniref:Transposase n=1 Tax=Halovulum dunhuangense TaxID=1505036 RepID=A0A849L1Y3_9RHOB|nr:transposase [Halovulum dunhuangense]NNU80275.1 transposase [Halovulum dunhuangense]
MPPYRRPRRPGATVFFTVALAERGSDLLTREVEVLRDAVRRVRARRPFGIHAWVVLPDHLHCVWTLPEGDAEYGVRWGAIKAHFSRSLRERDAARGPGAGAPFLPTEFPVVRSGRYAGLKPGLRVGKRECAIWQRRFWEHHIRDKADLVGHVRYCWANPVRHGLVERPEDWPFSSVHRDMAAGRYR